MIITPTWRVGGIYIVKKQEREKSSLRLMIGLVLLVISVGFPISSESLDHVKSSFRDVSFRFRFYSLLDEFQAKNNGRSIWKTTTNHLHLPFYNDTI